MIHHFIILSSLLLSRYDLVLRQAWHDILNADVSLDDVSVWSLVSDLAMTIIGGGRVRPGENGRGRNKLVLLAHVGYPEVWMRVIMPDLRKQNDHKQDGEGPGGQKPDDGELPLNGGVVTDYGEHVEPLNGHPEDREEARDDGHNK